MSTMRLKLLFTLLMFPVLLFGRSELFEIVEKVGVGMQEYTLGALLNSRQKAIAKMNPEKANVAGTYKFQDDSLHIVADIESDRVILIYKMYDAVDRSKMQKTLSDAIGEFEEPTIVSHDTIIYWFYHEDAHKMTPDEFESWRNRIYERDDALSAKSSLVDVLKSGLPKSSKEPLQRLITVKLQSDRPFSSKGPYVDASVYLMISSERLIRENYSAQ